MTFKNHPQNVEEWLVIATQKLSHSAKQRIRAEIEAHFEEAVATHQTGGASETGARAMALDELGDARAAGKRFRNRYLVAWEAKHLDYLLSPKVRTVLLINNCVYFGAIVVFSFHLLNLWNTDHDSRDAVRLSWLPLKILLQFIALVLVPIASLLLRKYRSTSNPESARQTVLLESSSGLCVGILVQYVFDACMDRATDVVHCLPSLILFLVCMSMFLLGLRISN